MPDPHDHNRQAWNRLARQGHRFSRPPSEAEFRDPLGTVDGPGWLEGDIRRKRLLCLAAGGGRQGPLYAAAGATVTVVDISEHQLELDRQVAQDRTLQLQTVQTSMDDLSMFATAEFDIVIHPVSTCYVPDLSGVYAEISRVVRPGGLYLSQHKTPNSLQLGADLQGGQYVLAQPYYLEGPLPPAHHSRIREEGTQEYVHRWESLLGQMCRSGFVLEDLIEPFHSEPHATVGSFGHRSHFVAPYVRIKARRRNSDKSTNRDELWTPG